MTAPSTGTPAPGSRASISQARRQRRTRLWAGTAAVLIVIGAAIGGVVAFSGGDDGSSKAAAKPPTSSVAPGPAVQANQGVSPMRAATSKGNDVPVYAQPDASGQPMVVLTRLTEYRAPRTLLAFDQYQDWLHVYLPTRPNNATAWVRASDVTVSQPLEYAVRVSLADHKLWVLKNGAVTLTADTAIGSSDYPTPTGTFYFTDPVDLHAQPNTAYGVFAYGLSGHSDVLTEFGGGDGQIAIHGTNDPSGIGKDVSHGCVRVLNDVIEQISKLPLGTPVYIY
jgi:lipoprotein-anchoring transpeptidase ErfK/SrfK